MYYVFNVFNDWERFNTFAEAADCAIELAFYVNDEARIVKDDYVDQTDDSPVITEPERVITVGTPYVPPTRWNPEHPNYNELIEADYLVDDRYF